MGVMSVNFGNYVSRERVVAIVASDSQTTKSVVFADDGRAVVSGLGMETLAKRMNGAAAEASNGDLG